MQTYFMDCGKGKKLQFVDSENNVLDQQKSVFAFLEAYAPCRIVTETAMLCKEPDERNQVIEMAQALGVEILTCGTRTTNTYRKLWNIPKIEAAPEGDIEDARLIRDIFYKTDVVFLPIKRATVRPPTIQRRANKLGAKGVKAILGPVAETPLEVRKTLADEKAYAKIVSLFVTAAMESATRQEFIRKVGCYGHGYPNLLRATFYRRVKVLVRRSLGIKRLSAVPLADQSPAFRSQQKRLFTALKWLYHRVKQTTVERTTAIPKRTTTIPEAVAA